MKNKKFLIAIFSIILISAGIYAYFGGFSTPEITRIISPEIHIAGKEYQGSVKADEFGDLFLEAGQLVAQNKINGELGGIYYNDPEKHQDSIHAFIGVIIPNLNTPIPAGYKVRTLPAGKKAVQGKVESHLALAPAKLFPAIFSYAKEHNIALQDFFVECYPDTDHAEVIVFEK
jgi:hypothetical protein